MRRFFLALLLVVTLRPCAAEIIQLERQHGTYTVPVRINGAMTLPFVLDSGAAAVTIPEDVFLTLTRTGTVKTSDFIGTGTVVLARRVATRQQAVCPPRGASRQLRC
jgi:hypothetical protein